MNINQPSNKPLKIGILVIGQTPRPDLADPVRGALPGMEIAERGALDRLSFGDLPDASKAAYPLVTRMRDGELVTVPEAFLSGRLQSALEELEADGVAASILLCAGTFAELKGRQPLFKPFAIGRQILNALGYQRLGLIAPIPAQEAPITARWQQAGFQPTVWTADVTCQDRSFYATLAEQVQAHALQAIVLDYVGHDLAHIRQLQRAVDLPVFDLGQLCVAALVGALD